MNHPTHFPLAVPDGFEPTPMGGPFIASLGPLHLSTSRESPRLGLRIEERHCNTMGHCHGGMLASFADMMMPAVMYPHPVLAADPHLLPTISLQLDYLAPVVLGSWIEGEAQVLKVTRSVVFCQGLVTSNGKPVLRCSGVYKVGPAVPPGHPGMYTNTMDSASPR